MFRMCASNSHSYTHLILALGIVREPTVWGLLLQTVSLTRNESQKNREWRGSCPARPTHHAGPGRSPPRRGAARGAALGPPRPPRPRCTPGKALPLPAGPCPTHTCTRHTPHCRNRVPPPPGCAMHTCSLWAASLGGLIPATQRTPRTKQHLYPHSGLEVVLRGLDRTPFTH